MADVANLIETKLRNECRNRISFDKHFLVGQQLGFESADQMDLTLQRERLIRRSFLQDKERIAAVILSGKYDGASMFSAKFRALLFFDDSNRSHSQDCAISIRVNYRPQGKNVIRNIDVTVVLTDYDKVDAPEVTTHVWN